ncbi:MAG: hypothetical protein IBX43_06820 [Campylobacterales bacterium]|nr:hypothetical protein [Campylobacterales bacterium]
MNRLLATSALGAALLFSGCAKTTAFDFFSTDTYYEKAISNMQKVSLMSNMETKALLHAIYLNNVDPQTYSGDEYFFVAVHIMADAYDPKKRGLMNSDYRLKILERMKVESDDITKAAEYKADVPAKAEEKEVLVYTDPVEVKELDENDKLRLTMPIRSQWNYYYLVRYSEVNSSTLKLSFESDQYGKAGLKFQKEK